MSKIGFKFRDVYFGLQKLRNFLLGRKHILHNRFPPLVAPRSIPPPDIPRGPVIKYSSNYYVHRHVFDSVKPPIVAPIAEGPPIAQDPTAKTAVGGVRPDAICFSCAPTPGRAWWWDGHCYYEGQPDTGQCPEPQCNPVPPAPDRRN